MVEGMYGMVPYHTYILWKTKGPSQLDCSVGYRTLHHNSLVRHFCNIPNQSINQNYLSISRARKNNSKDKQTTHNICLTKEFIVSNHLQYYYH
jgi:hypothetical protein